MHLLHRASRATHLRVLMLAAITFAAFAAAIVNVRADENPSTFFMQDRATHQRVHVVFRPRKTLGRSFYRSVVRFARRTDRDVHSAGSSLIAEASKFLGSGNFTGSHRAWCADAMNAWLKRTGHRTSGSAAAISFAHYGQRLPGPKVGAIAVFRHHVAIVTKVLGHGRVQTISGNWSHRVKRATVSTRGAIAFRRPV